MDLKIGDEVLFRKETNLYKGRIKSIFKNKIEIDDDTIELVIAAVSKGTVADNISFICKNKGEIS